MIIYVCFQYYSPIWL